MAIKNTRRISSFETLSKQGRKKPQTHNSSRSSPTNFMVDHLLLKVVFVIAVNCTCRQGGFKIQECLSFEIEFDYSESHQVGWKTFYDHSNL